jgi:hypothetical protein
MLIFEFFGTGGIQLFSLQVEKYISCNSLELIFKLFERASNSDLEMTVCESRLIFFFDFKRKHEVNVSILTIS